MRCCQARFVDSTAQQMSLAYYCDDARENFFAVAAVAAATLTTRDFPPPVARVEIDRRRTFAISLSVGARTRARLRFSLLLSSAVSPHRTVVFAPTTFGNVASSCDVLSHTVPNAHHHTPDGSK